MRTKPLRLVAIAFTLTVLGGTPGMADDKPGDGYSLITTEITRVQMSNVAKVQGLQAPTGPFVNVPRYPPADYRGVSAPNADTLYSIGSGRSRCT